MLSKLENIIDDIAEKNGIKIEEYNMRKIKAIERELNENGDVDTAMEKLDKVLGFSWDKYYLQIRKQLERNK